MVKLTCAVLAMVIFLSRMANIRTSFFTVRIPVWNRSGSTLRSVGSGNILLLVPCGQEQCVVCQRVRRVHLLMLRGLWITALLGHAGDSLGSCVFWEVQALPVYLLICTGLGLRRCAHCWTRPLGGVGGGIIYVTGEFTGAHKSAPHVVKCLVVIHHCGALHASLSGTAQFAWS